jgi:hypothetical protein
VFPVEINDSLLFPFLEPVVPGDLAVVIVVLSVSLAPCIKLTHSNPQTTYEIPFVELPLVPVMNEVHHLVTTVRLNPAGF